MNKNDVVAAFSKVCDYIADNFQDLLIPNLTDGMEMITPHFDDAHITDITNGGSGIPI